MAQASAHEEFPEDELRQDELLAVSFLRARELGDGAGGGRRRVSVVAGVACGLLALSAIAAVSGGQGRSGKEIASALNSTTQLVAERSFVQIQSGDVCLYVNKAIAGEPVRVGECNWMSDKTQFFFPVGEGTISYAGNPELCVDGAPGGNIDNGQQVQLWRCGAGISSEQWLAPASGTGEVRLRHSPKKCLTSDPADGVARLYDCGGKQREAQQWGPLRKKIAFGDPSFLCVAVMVPGTYEQEILSSQLSKIPELKQDVGIFGCDEFQVYAKADTSLGWHWSVGWVHARPFKQAYVGKTDIGMAANSLLFIYMWEAVVADGVYKRHHFTIKVDPDCVLLPDRMRNHLRPHAGPGAKFWRTCDRVKDALPLWPMLYGPAEVLSREAVTLFHEHYHMCTKGGNYVSLGEDLFMTGCLDTIGAHGVVDLGLLNDDHCYTLNCRQPGAAAFHALKDYVSWWKCWGEATGNR